MAIRQSTQSGNTHTAPFAFGTAVVDGDQLQITSSAHAIVFDQSCAIGISLCTTQQGRPTVAATGSGGSLSSGSYRVRIAAVGTTGITTASASSLTATITAGQVVRVTLPTLPAGAATWSVYLTQAGGAAGTERRYATALAPGTFDCAAPQWENDSTPYASAATTAFGDAFGYSTPTTHSGGVTIAANVTVTCRGDFSILGNFTRNAGSALLFDASASPSAVATYRLFCGTVLAAGLGTIISRGSALSRATIASAPGTAPASIRNAAQTSTSSDVRLDLQWDRFTRIGDASTPAITGKCAATYNHLLSDVVFDADCGSVELSSAPATGGWGLLRTTFAQSIGTTSLLLSATADKTTGLRTTLSCAFTGARPTIQAGGALYDNCYFEDGWTHTSSGGGITLGYELRHSFVRKLMVGAGAGVDTLALAGQSLDNYLYIDNVTGPTTTDLNPHGLGLGANATVERVHDGWTVEYNGNSGSGDMFKSPGSTPGTVKILRALILPNANNVTSGTIFTFPNTLTAYRLHVEHCTYLGEATGLATSEGGLQAAGTIAKFRSNLAFSISGVTSSRFAIGKATGDGQNDTIDIAAPGDVTHNAGWNLQDVTGTFVGGYSWYNTRFSSAPGAGDVDLGDSPGASIALVGPMFVDPTRKFITWCAVVLGATGTPAQTITAGLNALRALADTTSPDHVPGLLATDPATWVRVGWAPRNPLLRYAASDGSTIGAVAAPFIPPCRACAPRDFHVLLGSFLDGSQCRHESPIAR